MNHFLATPSSKIRNNVVGSNSQHNGNAGTATLTSIWSSANTNHWSCPRCTLHNLSTANACEACNFKRRTAIAMTTTATSTTTAATDTRMAPRARAGPVSRERLHSQVERRHAVFVQAMSVSQTAAAAASFSPSFQLEPPQKRHPPYLYSGMIVGGVFGLVCVYLRGDSATWAILEVAMSGAFVWVLLHDLMEQSATNINSFPGFRLTGTRKTSQADTSGTRAFCPDEQHAQPPPPQGAPTSTGNLISRSALQAAVAYDDPLVAFIMRSMEENISSRVPRRMRSIEDNSSSRVSRRMTGARGSPNLDGGMSLDQLLQRFGDGSENNTRAAREEDIQSLPLEEVHDPNKLPEDCRRCAICLDSFEAGTFRKTLPCLHGFHNVCVDKWLRTNGACPICKHCIDC
jgi:hypothetical protein